MGAGENGRTLSDTHPEKRHGVDSQETTGTLISNSFRVEESREENYSVIFDTSVLWYVSICET